MELNDRMEGLSQCIDGVLDKREILSLSMNKRNIEKVFKKLEQMRDRLWVLRDTYQRIKRKEEPLKVGILGEFSAGKSMFVNSLLGENLLGVDSAPKTARVTLIKYGDEIRFYGVKRLNDGTFERKELSWEEYNRLANKKDEEEKLDNGAIDPIYDYFEIYFPSDILRLVNIIDTPGFSEAYDGIDKITVEWMEKVDAVFWVIDGLPGLTSSSIKRLKEMPDGVPVMAVLNKIDRLPPSKRHSKRNYVERSYRFQKVFLYSAEVVLGLEEKRKNINSTLDELVNSLKGIMDDGRPFIVESCRDDDTIWIISKDLKSKSVKHITVKKRPSKVHSIHQQDNELIHAKGEIIRALLDFKKSYGELKINLITREFEDMQHDALETFTKLKQYLETERYSIVEDRLRQDKKEGLRQIRRVYDNLKIQMLDEFEDSLKKGSTLTKSPIERLAKELGRRADRIADRIMDELRGQLEDSYNGITFPETGKNREEIIRKFINASFAALNIKDKCSDLDREAIDLLIADEQIYETIRADFATKMEIMISFVDDKYRRLIDATNYCIKFLKSSLPDVKH